MENLRLKNKILLILVLPLIAIFILSFILILAKIEKEKNMARTSSYIEFTVIVSKFLTNLQKERELSILFLNSYGKDKKSEFETQIKDSNESFVNLENFIKEFKLVKDDNNLLKKINIYKNDILQLNQMREKIIKLQMNDKEILNFYEPLADYKKQPVI